MIKNKKIYNFLVVSDNQENREHVSNLLRDKFRGAQVNFEESIIGTSVAGRAQKYDIVFIDYNMSGFKGEKSLSIIQARSEKKVVLIVEKQQQHDALSLLSNGAANYYVLGGKPSNVFERIVRAELNGVSNIQILRDYVYCNEHKLLA